ncbi:hypothetical protein HDU76_000978 [Blyttiomyces sp. JEL0837]|nr:hypothetical protein HDU76_000978 [Blyttiomyces sp. JEL0837]
MLPLLVLGLTVFIKQTLAFDLFLTKQGNQFVSFTSTITVPEVPVLPANTATYFLVDKNLELSAWWGWPGLQPGSQAVNFLPIDNGVLQPVLTFGPTCAPGSNSAEPYKTWSISAQYVNTFGHEPGFTGCLGGPFMDVNVGDKLKMEMKLSGTKWIQTVTNTNNGKSVDYTIDMKGQSQGWAELVIELYGEAKQYFDVLFTGIEMTVQNAEDAFCQGELTYKENEQCSSPTLSADKKTCTISQCLFQANAPRPSSSTTLSTSSTTSNTVSTSSSISTTGTNSMTSTVTSMSTTTGASSTSTARSSSSSMINYSAGSKVEFAGVMGLALMVLSVLLSLA